MEPSDVRSMCCRLRLDLRELRKKSGGFFGSGESTGSIGVVTINLPRIAYLAENVEDFYKRLDKLMDISARSLKVKRGIITKLLDEGLYPYTKRYLGTFTNHFSTIGLIGMNEVGLNAKWLRKDMTHKETQEFAKDVLNHMRERLSDYQEEYGDLYNLEATPAESTTYRFAKHDKEKYPTIITANENGTPYYTNSSHLPVGYTADIFEALDAQDELHTLYTSGTVFHAFLGEKLPDWKAAANLVKKIADNYRLPYYSISPTYTVCCNHGYIQGEVYTCPDCGETTEKNVHKGGNATETEKAEKNQEIPQSDVSSPFSFSSIQFRYQTSPEGKQLLIEGKIHNDTNVSQMLPEVVYAKAYDQHGRILFQKEIYFSKELMAPFAQKSFYSTYIPAPDGIQWMEVSCEK
jgi:ribonucleoside-triphosphate reductase